MKAFPGIQPAIETILNGGLIAYPTEACFGLGCDPHRRESVERIASLKQRPLDKGMILIGASFDQFAPLLAEVPAPALDAALATWPGPHTWVFPASANAPRWITGLHGSIAIRVSDHPLVRELCTGAAMPIVSTSANPQGLPPALNADQARRYFPTEVDIIVEGDTGGLERPTEIRNVLDGEILREGS